MADNTATAIRPFFDGATNTVTYLVWDPATRRGAVVDPVLDWDNRSGEADTASAAAVLAAAEAEGITIDWVLETHVHADHLTAAPWIKARTGARIGIGEGVKQVQTIFRPVFALQDVLPEGGDFDHLFADGETFALGTLQVEVLHVPGHTPACVAYKIGAAPEARSNQPADVFVGDTLFMHDAGTARADFPGGDARTLYRSIKRILSLPPETRLWICHDYKAPGRDAFAWQSSVAAQRAQNPHVKDGMTEEDFIAFRTARDATLAAPTLLLPSIQVNIRAGRFPAAEANGVRYLKIPVTPKRGASLG
ncbi:MBL fold metallo-hydrolase [Roseomonas stagni]|uniref:MBL fold metallo-hydrolase n=1 Tax=Falsiroseomonas algicola TaxID=2716930 RepID=A0A6M1LGQ6_9PROT|nr:MBL fold metallo-hydrolase [Falsiroseomonas algicola]NGM19525.1 MBL fold metallo-hydrolase [Falsiroseomonas algicola]